MCTVSLVSKTNNEKKMTAKEFDFLSSREVIGFTLPVMHTTGSNWYVDFYALDPITGRMRRKKYMLNKYKTERNKRTMGSLIIHNLTAKLTAGWNPCPCWAPDNLYERVVEREKRENH